MYLGKMQDKEITVSKKAPNDSVLITGISGAGKTCRMNQMELNAVLSGKTVFILDTGQTHISNQVYKPLASEYENYANRINLQKEGLALRFPCPAQNTDSTLKIPLFLLNSIVDSITYPLRMGVLQSGALRKALIFAVNHQDNYPDMITSVNEGLKEQDSKEAEAVRRNLWRLSDFHIFQKNGCEIEKGKINILFLDTSDKITKRITVELLLTIFWYCIQNQLWDINNVLLVFDEFQNILLKDGCMLWDILREGRKFGVSLLMATQTLEVFPKNVESILNQAAVRLYFLPSKSELRKCAKTIDPSNTEYWINRLSHLKVGESVAVGYTNVGAKEITRPIILR